MTQYKKKSDWATYLFSKRFYDRFIRKIITSICRVYGK